jgi:F0F1-type ATP synthase assembly protein I
MNPSGLKFVSLPSSGQKSEQVPRLGIFDGRRQLVVQIGLVACCGAAGLLLGGVESALSALAGGAAAVAGTLAFLGMLRWRKDPAPTAWQALRALVMAESAKWAVSLIGLASLLSGNAGVDAVSAAPGAAVIGFCVAWAAPLLALVKRN